MITESTPLHNPFWNYSQDKIAAEDKLNWLYREHQFPVTIIRPSHTYEFVIPVAIGGWNDYTIIDRIRNGKPIIVHGDGTSLWTITHSDDFASGFIGLLANQQAIGHAFHITSDEILTWNQIYETVAEAAGHKPNLVHISSDFICEVADNFNWPWMRGNLLGDKAVSVIFDNSKIKRFVPAFKAEIPFSRGIRQTIAWFDADKSRQLFNSKSNRFIESVLSAYFTGK